MPALGSVLDEKIRLLADKHLRRHLVSTKRLAGARIERAGRTLISFSCNDYFGLTHHPKVIAASQAAVAAYGTGAGASRLVTGDHPLYQELEKRIAAFKGTETSLVFGSGYLANLGIVPALMSQQDLILIDKASHACMLDGARLSGATVLRFAHNKVEHCEALLERHRVEHENCLIMTETVFSMDGDLAPLEALHQLAGRYQTWLMTDDAHGMGIVKPTIVADIQMGTLSKGLAAYGGYVAISTTVREYLINFARSLMFTTALPPATLAAAIAALDVLHDEPDRLEKPLANARCFTRLLGMSDATSAIVPVILTTNEKAMQASRMLEAAGYAVAAIRPPTVPRQTARLRFAFTSEHQKTEIEAVARLLLKQGLICVP